WSRYASCEVYNVIAGTDVTCTRTGDPRAVVQHTAPPEGKLLKAVSRRGRLRVKGWALDPDAGADPVEVVITADGAVVGTTVADRQRTALQRTYGLGNFHGFVDSFVAGLSPGGHTVCATALNDSGKGPDTPLGCVDVVVDDPDGYPPQGALTYAAADGDVVVARGRARDRDTVAPIEVRLLVDGEDLATVLADRGAKHHKFKVRARLALDPGDHEVCAVALNYGDVQPDTPIGCLTVTVP
ncbi:MAG: hypothetical protein KQH83_12065, partial [Actinobacteria bacterium]|nr:hypothetical protein [Actinomycetota bacterium]